METCERFSLPHRKPRNTGKGSRHTLHDSGMEHGVEELLVGF